MRLWHKDLIPVLPREQLLGQWRELCLIAKNLALNGTPNHVLVNRVTDYPKWHLMDYALRVCKECERRGYKIDRYKFFKWFDRWDDGTVNAGTRDLFFAWHTDRYLYQCYYNLEEKFDAGAISKDAWLEINNFMDRRRIYGH